MGILQDKDKNNKNNLKMKKTKQKLGTLAKKPGVQHVLTAFVALLVVSSVAYVGTFVGKEKSKAAVPPPPPTALYLSPEAGTFAPGSTISVGVRLTSGTAPINSVQASLLYNSAQLQYVSISEGAAFPTVAATSTATPGVVRVGRAAQIQPITGDNLVVTVNFKVLATSGTSTLSFDPAFSYAVRSTDNVNALASTSGASYAITYPAPTISTVAPATGPSAGGTTITITGTNFRAGATVKVGTVSATAVTVVSASSITAVTPSQSTGGLKDISVTNADGQVVTRAAAFNSVVPAPRITSVAPMSGVIAGGTTITISGTNFVSGAKVTFDGPVGTGAAGAGVTFVNPTTITLKSPVHAAGSSIIYVTNPDNQVGQFAGYIFTPPPGDANNDGRVNALDLSILISKDGQNFPAADFNGDGTVGSADLSILLARWTW